MLDRQLACLHLAFYTHAGQAPSPSGGAQLADSTLDNDMVFPPGIEMIYDERCFLEGTPEAEGYVLNFDESEDGVEASCAVLGEI